MPEVGQVILSPTPGFYFVRMDNRVNTYEDGWVNSIKGAPRGTFKRGTNARAARDAPWREKYFDRKEKEITFHQERNEKAEQEAFQKKYERHLEYIKARNFHMDQYEQFLSYDDWWRTEGSKFFS